MGVLRARFRGREDPQYGVFGANYRVEELLSGNPDEVVRYEIGLRATANTFRKGHRIRVAVMNALDNYEFPNSNTGGDEALATTTVVGRMRIHHTPEHPTHILLPVMPSPPGIPDR
jgi:predicted acyl esterase